MSAKDLVVFYNNNGQLVVGEKVKSNSSKNLVVRNPAYLSVQPVGEGDDRKFVGRLFPVFIPEWVKNPEKGIKFTYDKSAIAYSETHVADNIVAEYETIFKEVA